MPHSQLTLAQLQARLNSRWDGSPFWTSEEGRLALNEALRVWNSLTGQWRSRVIVYGTGPWLTLPGTLTWPARVDFSSYPLLKTSVFQIDIIRPNWESETIASGGTTPSATSHWMPGGLTRIGIWPSGIASLHHVVIDGIARTPVLVNASDFIDIGEEELFAILGYAVHVASLKIGGSVFDATMSFFEAFRAAAALKNPIMRATQRLQERLWKHQTDGELVRHGEST